MYDIVHNVVINIPEGVYSSLELVAYVHMYIYYTGPA
jgi:hypothetical protein